MNTRVLRILALRALPLLVVILLFLVVAWFALPSSPYLTDDGVTFPTYTLQSGNVLTRVYALNDFFPFWDNSPPVVLARRHGREYFSLDFSISSPPPSLKFSPYHNVSLDFGQHTQDGIITLSSKEIYGPARMGNLDGINAPWFPVADATLLFWQIHEESIDLPLRVRHGQGRVEVWPATAQWDQMTPGKNPSYLTPLLTLELIPSEHDDLHIIATTPRPPISSSPSSTYPLRVGILNILLILYFTFNIIGYPFGIALGLLWSVIKFAVQITGLLGLLLFVIWWWKGRPPLEEIQESVAGVLGRTTEMLHPPSGPSSSGERRRSGEQVRKTRVAGEPDLEAGNPPLDECDIGVKGSS
ncbi:uncharacterized protein STEHIDRAFT_168231 [Stereum hirsutum FP-91666 SS1]|uniref:uncharacterized protein n=1 Tax=Stereum hirsutum (strain FP-91666) TaxID=721885 RepID=UPI000440C2F6|nr:uncharacterized protein STEHIDRAFT_168231 [Stereum hirsutum FP-91666 SS1]EIM87507.1 hypothetical protein STEHIDRAFT_168231 [Stereum hirsutum FP-91666 SS1]